MSADNGVYILKTKRTALEKPQGRWTMGVENYVYRVSVVSAIDNLDYYMHQKTYNLGAYMHEAWGKSMVYSDEKDAMMHANKIDKDYCTEYGVCFVDMSEYIFYGDI